MSKPCAFKGQPLTSHIEGSLKIARMLIKEGYQDTLSTRLAKASGSRMRRDELKDAAVDMIEISVIFHDIGKALKAYQDNYDNNCSCTRNPCGFPLHEIFSAIYLYMFLNQHSSTNIKWKRMLPLISVINHMHGLRDYRKIKDVDVKNLYNTVKGDSYIEREHAEILTKKIIELKDTFYGHKIDESKLMGILSSRLTNLNVWIEKIVDEIEYANITNRWLKLYTLILVPLTIGDNCDSVENRLSDPNEHNSRKAYTWELCCNSLGYYLEDSISGLKVCRNWG